MRPAVIVCPLADWLPDIPDAVYIGADAGADRILEAGKELYMAVGDFDSADHGPDYACRTEVLPVHKDIPDSQACLQLAKELGFSPLYLVGGMAGRIDHTIANIRLCGYHYEDLILLEKDQQVKRLGPGVHTVENKWKNVSFFALEETVISLDRFKYELKDYFLTIPDILCLSNQVAGPEGTVTIRCGAVLCILTNL